MKEKNRPNLMGFILCENTIIDKETNNISLINVFDSLNTERVPFRQAKIVVFVYWYLETKKEIEIQQTVRLIDPDKEEIASLNIGVNFNRNKRRNGSTFNFVGVRFDKVGEHKFQLLVDGKLLKEVPLPVRVK